MKAFNYEERKANAIERNEARLLAETAERQRRIELVKDLPETTQRMIVAQDLRYRKQRGQMMPADRFEQMVAQVRALKR